MPEYIVVETTVETDLAEFSRYLWQHNIPHRVVDESGRRLLLVGTEEDARQVGGAYRAWATNSAELPLLQRAQRGTSMASLRRALATAPVTAVLLALSIAGFLLVEFDPDYSMVKWLTFFEFERRGNAIVFSLPAGEYWRLITPIFLHFGVLHIVFNGLWLWDLGRRIERIQGSDKMIGIVMVLALGSNIAQTMYATVSVFGGMSGVIYGLLGYGWMWSLLCPQRSVGIPRAVIGFMLGWLVLCMLGFASLLGAGAVANAAHVGGLVMGMILGVGAGLIARASGKA